MTLELVKSRKREEMAAQLHFSYSQLNTYLLCPMKYAHSYVWGTPWESKSSALIFGGAIHKSAEEYYLILKETGEVIPADQMIALFETSFDNQIENTEVELTFKKDETAQSLRQQGIDLIKLFHSEVSPQKIVAVETPFSVAVPDIINGQRERPEKLVGYFDLVEADSDGSYAVVELKTSAQRFSSLRLAYDIQSTVYSYAMSKMKVATSESSCLVRYDVLVKTRKAAFEHYYVTRTVEDHQRLIHLINHVLKAIENRVFYRQTGWPCEDCQFRRACFS